MSFYEAQTADLIISTSSSELAPIALSYSARMLTVTSINLIPLSGLPSSSFYLAFYSSSTCCGHVQHILLCNIFISIRFGLYFYRKWIGVNIPLTLNTPHRSTLVLLRLIPYIQTLNRCCKVFNFFDGFSCQNLLELQLEYFVEHTQSKTLPVSLL